MYKAITCKLTNIQKHPNADNLNIANALGNIVIVGKDYVEGTYGVFFADDGQLSDEFLKANDLYRKEIIEIVNGKEIKKKIGYFDEKRRVTCQKLRGIISFGLFVPTRYFDFIIQLTNKQLPEDFFKEGYQFTELNGIHICNKYYARRNPIRVDISEKSKIKKNDMRKYSAYTCLKQHVDYDQLRNNLNNIKEGSNIIITVKTHGTSAVTGFVPVIRKLSWWEKIIYKFKPNSINEKQYEFKIGTRNVVLDDGELDAFYKDKFRIQAADLFRGKLLKGETIYYEILGYTTDGKPLMGTHHLDKLKKIYIGVDKFTEEMTYSYGCEVGQHKVQIYRITMTNEDGFSRDLSWEEVKKRAKELNIDTVMELDKFYYNGNPELLLLKCEDFNSQIALKPSVFDSRHIDEGVVIRIENGNSVPTFLKEKAHIFKVLEGIAKENGLIDKEEEQQLYTACGEDYKDCGCNNCSICGKACNWTNSNCENCK
jgi:hypothetical protein